jgi:hypothetical protein
VIDISEQQYSLAADFRRFPAAQVWNVAHRYHVESDASFDSAI